MSCHLRKSKIALCSWFRCLGAHFFTKYSSYLRNNCHHSVVHFFNTASPCFQVEQCLCHWQGKQGLCVPAPWQGYQALHCRGARPQAGAKSKLRQRIWSKRRTVLQPFFHLDLHLFCNFFVKTGGLQCDRIPLVPWHTQTLFFKIVSALGMSPHSFPLQSKSISFLSTCVISFLCSSCSQYKENNSIRRRCPLLSHNM